MKIHKILIMIGFLFAGIYPAQAALETTTDTFQFIENTRAVADVYLSLAICAYKKKNYVSAKEECEKALRVDPNNCKAIDLMNKLASKSGRIPDRKILQSQVEEYQKQILDLKMEKASLEAEYSRKLQKSQMLAKQNKQTADRYGQDMEALKNRFNTNVAESVKYQAQLSELNTKQLALNSTKDQVFYTKNEVFAAVDNYALVQNNKLQEIGDVTLASAASLQKNADNIEEQKKIIDELSQQLDTYKKNIEEQRKILFRQTHRFELMEVK
ncbi:MAG: tetratricopeptide repeat protein [Candidatus Omnitrophica bacterium]|nr:tetratricopeptide repeat protein [Candidatus Omnitrophota bacterium]